MIFNDEEKHMLFEYIWNEIKVSDEDHINQPTGDPWFPDWGILRNINFNTTSISSEIDSRVPYLLVDTTYIFTTGGVPKFKETLLVIGYYEVFDKSHLRRLLLNNLVD